MEKEKRFTGGEWRVLNIPGRPKIYADVPMPAGNIVRQEIAEMKHDMTCGMTADQMAKNTILIAAAPDMLKALKHAMAVISQHYPENIRCCENRIQFITDTIKKAQGAQ